MVNTTPWFDAKVHSPVRPGWYDCKKCQARHFWIAGSWYRNAETLKSGDAMHVQSMHWRGLAQSPALSGDAEYKKALKTVSVLIDMDSKFGTSHADRLLEQGTLVETYEAQHYELATPTIKSFTTTFEEDPLTKDLLMIFPEEFLKTEDWRTDDRIQMDASKGLLIMTNLSKEARQG